jgi:hypothetical protein
LLKVGIGYDLAGTAGLETIEAAGGEAAWSFATARAFARTMTLAGIGS